MENKKSHGKDAEVLIQKYYQYLMNQTSIKTGYTPVLVQNNVIMTGKSGASHQIDVYWEFEMAQTRYKTIIEVKDWKSRVKKEQIAAFKSVIDDIPGNPKGIYVSFSDFQSGAVTFASHHGIELIKVTPDGNRSFLHKVYFDHIHTTELKLGINEWWMKENNIPESLIASIEDDVFAISLIDADGNTKSVLELVEDEEDKHADAMMTGMYESEIVFDKDFFYQVPYDNTILIKIESIWYKFTLTRELSSIVIEEEDIPAYIITDLTNGTVNEFSNSENDESTIASIRYRNA